MMSSDTSSNSSQNQNDAADTFHTFFLSLPTHDPKNGVEVYRFFIRKNGEYVTVHGRNAEVVYNEYYTQRQHEHTSASAQLRMVGNKTVLPVLMIPNHEMPLIIHYLFQRYGSNNMYIEIYH